MTQNDVNTLNGALMELGELMADNLVAKGVSASASDGLTTLANKVLDIQQGGSCYNIEFSQSEYTATGGAVTLECTLQQNYAPLPNATVTLSDGSSVYSSITNQYGVASFSLTGLTTSATYTCSYGNVSDTCTVTVVNYLFYDECNSADGLTNYSNIRLLESGGNTTLALEYNSTENAYKWTCRSGKAVILGIDPLDGVTSNFRLTCQVKKTTSNHFIGLAYAQTELTGFGYGSDGGGRWKGHGYSNGSYTGGINETGSSSANTWYCIELIKQGTSITINCYDSTKTTLYASTSKTYSDNDNYFGFMSFNNGGVFYIKNIIAELI